jgi:hypothetical protein
MMIPIFLGLILGVLVICAVSLTALVRRFAEMDVDNAKKMIAVYQAIDSLRVPLESLVQLEQTKQESRAGLGVEALRERLKVRAAQLAQATERQG